MDVPDSTLQSAALECLEQCKWFPTVAEVRERCKPTQTGMTVEQCVNAILAEHPELADEAVLRARLYQRELANRRWRTAHWAETVALDKRLWAIDHPKLLEGESSTDEQRVEGECGE